MADIRGLADKLKFTVHVPKSLYTVHVPDSLCMFSIHCMYMFPIHCTCSHFKGNYMHTTCTQSIKLNRIVAQFGGCSRSLSGSSHFSLVAGIIDTQTLMLAWHAGSIPSAG